MARPFHELAEMLGQGKFDERATEIWREIIRAVAENGGVGAMTITLSAEQVGGKIEVSTKFKSKKPYPPVPSTAYWATGDGDLVDEDPHQRVLPFGGPRSTRGPKKSS